ncbi:MAG: hypothetical protein HQ559_13535 [Lentisphaerae bacterium]|nr:hypothetical protein [Lentisphaerota bacterium]
MRHPKIAAMILILAAVAVSCQMGAGKVGNERMRVTLSGDGTITLEGRTVSLERLPAKLKSAGAGPQTAIEIAVGANTPHSRMTEITRALASAGLSRIMFLRPRKADASTKSK